MEPYQFDSIMEVLHSIHSAVQNLNSPKLVGEHTCHNLTFDDQSKGGICEHCGRTLFPVLIHEEIDTSFGLKV